MDWTKYQNPIGLFHFKAVYTSHLHELLHALPSCNFKYMSILSYHIYIYFYEWDSSSTLICRTLPVTIYTMSQPTWTMSCCGSTIQGPSFSPKAYRPRSIYRSKRVPATHSWSWIICHMVFRVMHHDTNKTIVPGPLIKP